ncbi:MAG: hypothetical protein ABIP50_00170 [Candidatus Saccharimonadales bacterium]
MKKIPEKVPKKNKVVQYIVLGVALLLIGFLIWASIEKVDLIRHGAYPNIRGDLPAKQQ